MTKSIQIPIGEASGAVIPYPMTEEDFLLLIQTLHLWREKLISKPVITVQTP